MLIDEMFDRVLTMSGQFLLRPENIELNVDRFRYCVQSALGEWNKCRIISKPFISLRINRKHVFHENDKPYGIPDGILKVVPTGVVGINTMLFQNQMHPGSFHREASSPWLEQKSYFPYLYQKPVLTLYVDSEVNVHAWWYHKLVKTEGVNSTWRCDTIEEKDIVFFDLLQAKFMYALGRQRNAFTMADIPILMDAADLINEAMAMEERAKEELHTSVKQWYKAFGG